MKNENLNPIVLTILDGWGYSNDLNGNAIKLANTPNIDYLWNNYNHTLLNASGKDVGLPTNQMGNSEVGHTTIGAGRIINQDLVKISTSIKNKSFFNNSTLNNICKNIKLNKSKLHLIGLCSDGGVHSHISHLTALIKIVKTYNITTCIHVITDGRDTKPNASKLFIEQIIKEIKGIKNINICTISGRYYSMDRDCRWSRTQKAYNILINNRICTNSDPITVIQDNYHQGISDEFIIPTRIYSGEVSDNDGIIFFNFRPDRMRQLIHCFTKKTFKGFKIYPRKNLSVISFTQYDSSLYIPIVFPPEHKKYFLGEIISQQGLKQFRLAETEKYAHVTYFFNGGLEEPFPGEDRELISSPKVETYDLAPEMSAYTLTNNVIKTIKKNYYHFIVINYANPDMVGHTGNLSATIEAINTVDKCIGQLFEAVKLANCHLIITADHGNAEYMLNEHNEPCTSHSTNLVPFILINNNEKQQNQKLRNNGCLADIAPTILDILNIQIPLAMDGKSLLNNT
uniref:phosphoglycerate mutase n=1 Tax=Hypnea brasiliensis TaxID=1866962 RepID=UPI0023F3E659|nr:phosphoglycerate mutase [Hypnea brasiliensis]WCH55280.1 phosphoglycerate mutase [Hypnea brasiliensis]WDY84745.1 phosphoglycerate mutase [Hypnea brasiliensis]